MSYYYPSYGSYGTSSSSGPRGSTHASTYGIAPDFSDPAYINPDASPSHSSHREEPKSYFLPSYCISRQVILNHYQFYLGPSATIRPFRYQHREGYMLTHVGKPLTRSQIEDLKQLSLEYEEQESERMMRSCSVFEAEDVAERYISQPIPIQQRTAGYPETNHGHSRR